MKRSDRESMSEKSAVARTSVSVLSPMASRNSQNVMGYIFSMSTFPTGNEVPLWSDMPDSDPATAT